MAWVGRKYKLDRQENFEEYMKALGELLFNFYYKPIRALLKILGHVMKSIFFLWRENLLAKNKVIRNKFRCS